MPHLRQQRQHALGHDGLEHHHLRLGLRESANFGHVTRKRRHGELQIRRVRKARIYKSSSSGTSVYVYDGDNLVEETNATGGVVARYSQGLNIDEPLAMLRSGVTSFYQADGLGSVTSLTNMAGAAAQTTLMIPSASKPPRLARLRIHFSTQGVSSILKPASTTTAPDTTIPRREGSSAKTQSNFSVASIFTHMSEIAQSTLRIHSDFVHHRQKQRPALKSYSASQSVE
jgi:hypothetical protein